MKKTLSLLAMVFAIGLSSVAMDAEAARRLGSGKSIGMQRQSTPPAKAPNAAPAQTPTAAPGAAAAAPAAAAASTRSKWLGPIAGLAAGLGLAALASHLGFGEGLANMLMIGLLVVAAFAAFRFFMAKRAASQGGGAAYAGAGAGAGAGNAGNNAFRMPSTPASNGSTGTSQGGSMIGSALGGQAQTTSAIPADFDVAAFVRNAKVNFIRLQAANDTGNLDDIRAFTSPEMFAEIQMDIRERNGATQETRVLDLEASVLEVAEEGPLYVVSTHFTGRVQENGEDPEAINEIWHLTKPRQGNGGWVLAGIQQNT